MSEVQATVELRNPNVQSVRQTNLYVVKNGKWELETVCWGDADRTRSIEHIRAMHVQFCIVDFTLPAIQEIADPCV